MGGYGGDFADKLLSRVDHMRSEVAQDAIAYFGIVMPVVFRFTVPPLPIVKLGVIDFADVAICNELLHVLQVGHPSVGEVGHVYDPDLFCPGQHLPGQFGIGRQGLFAHHMQPGIKRRHGHGVVFIIRRSDNHGIEVVLCIHFAIVGIYIRNIVLFGHLFGGFSPAATNGHSCRPRVVPQSGQVHDVVVPARPDDADTYLFSHDLSSDVSLMFLFWAGARREPRWRMSAGARHVSRLLRAVG